MFGNRLTNANHAARCAHVKVNGLPCGAPARHGRELCCFHDSAARRNREFVLPIIEDAASLQLALNKILQGIVDKLIDHKTASTLLYGLQIAAANLKRLDAERTRERLDRIYPARRESQAPSAPQAANRNQPSAIGNAAGEDSSIPTETHESDPLGFFDKLAKALGFSETDMYGTPADSHRADGRSPHRPIEGERFDIQACLDPLSDRSSRRVH
jgi:hypothetical protein